jgi:voltage-gated potassium channel Kch
MVNRSVASVSPAGTDRGLRTPLRKEARYLFLLVSLLLLFFFYPFFDQIIIGPQVLGVVFLIILLAGLQSLSGRGKLFYAALALALLGYGAFLAGGVVESLVLQVITVLCYTLFFGLMTVTIVGNIWRVRAVTLDTIFGSVCAYLVLGMTWAMGCILIGIFVPGSYAAGGQPIVFGGPGGKEVYADFIYYSFVTLTTLGYGDMIPLSPPARSLAALEAVVGQMFIAVLVARLVGMQIAASQESR